MHRLALALFCFVVATTALAYGDPTIGGSRPSNKREVIGCYNNTWCATDLVSSCDNPDTSQFYKHAEACEKANSHPNQTDCELFRGGPTCWCQSGPYSNYYDITLTTGDCPDEFYCNDTISDISFTDLEEFTCGSDTDCLDNYNAPPQVCIGGCSANAAYNTQSGTNVGSHSYITLGDTTAECNTPTIDGDIVATVALGNTTDHETGNLCFDHYAFVDLPDTPDPNDYSEEYRRTCYDPFPNFSATQIE